jgi:hypothetical protein
LGEDPHERYLVSYFFYRFQTLYMKQNKNLQNQNQNKNLQN